MAGAFAETNVPRNHRPVDLFTEMILDLAGHRMGQAIPSIVHGQEQPLDKQPLVEALLHLANGLDQLRQPFQSKIFALHRNQDRVSGGQAIDGKKPQRGGTVNQDILKMFPDRTQDRLQPLLPILLGNELNLDPNQIDRCRQDRKILLGSGQDTVRSILGPGVTAVNIFILIRFKHANTTRGVPLWIRVDQQDPFACIGKYSGEV